MTGICQWDFGNGETAYNSQEIITYSEAGSYEITLITSSAESCNLSDTIVQEIEIFEPVFSEFTVFPEWAFVLELVEIINTSIGADSYQWIPGDGTEQFYDDSLHTGFFYAYDDPGTYTICLWASNEAGCEDSVCHEINIKIESTIILPNAFSPNGDGLNDKFLVIQEGIKELILLQVFNRWGDIIYNGNELTEGWDGTYKGKDQELGTYIYFLEAINSSDEKIVLKGNVTLMR